LGQDPPLFEALTHLIMLFFAVMSVSVAMSVPVPVPVPVARHLNCSHP
jgi:hypothetical protein